MPEGHQHAGWIYGGISKTTNKPFYIAPKDFGCHAMARGHGLRRPQQRVRPIA